MLEATTLPTEPQPTAIKISFSQCVDVTKMMQVTRTHLPSTLTNTDSSSRCLGLAQITVPERVRETESEKSVFVCCENEIERASLGINGDE